MLPFRYALRNLLRDRSRLLQTVAGSAAVVFLVMAAAALNGGMAGALAASGSPANVILLGAGSEESIQRSEIPERAPGIAAAAIPGIAEILGARAVSPEIHYMTLLAAPGLEPAQGFFRGVAPAALLAHPQVRLLDGRFPRPGELLAGRLAAKALGLPDEVLATGARVRVDGADFTVSGTFAAPGTVMESEVWAVLGDIRALAQRETLSCVVLRMTGADGFDDADLFAKQRLDLELSAIRESDYYGRLAAFYRPVRAMTWITAALVAAGAVFGGLNTLYAAFAPRLREAATLQALGFGRAALALSFVQESLLACLLGTLAGALAALLLLDGIHVPFSIGAFALRVDPGVIALGLGAGVALGLVGALPPAWRCLRPPLPAALRG
jgi:putative ABC transport system permease protein